MKYVLFARLESTWNLLTYTILSPKSVCTVPFSHSRHSVLIGWLNVSSIFLIFETVKLLITMALCCIVNIKSSCGYVENLVLFLLICPEKLKKVYQMHFYRKVFFCTEYFRIWNWKLRKKKKLNLNYCYFTDVSLLIKSLNTVNSWYIKIEIKIPAYFLCFYF
jgi:hypothetical protein